MDVDLRRGHVPRRHCPAYKTFPFGCITHLFHVDKAPVREPVAIADARLRNKHWCEATVVYELREPILWEDIRDEPHLDRWHARQVKMHGTAFEIGRAQWRVLLDHLTPEDRLSVTRFAGR
jgi:hypothetical protein